MASYSRAAQQWATFGRAWYLLDAKMQPPGKIAAATVIRLEGRHKPIYHALNDCGDHVVIINTKHIAFSGNKWEQKVYSSHTGYPGGFKQVTATQLHLKDPTAGHRMIQIEEDLRKSLVQLPTRSSINYKSDKTAGDLSRQVLEASYGNCVGEKNNIVYRTENHGLVEGRCGIKLNLKIVKLAVYRMLPKNLQRRTLMQRLHLFPEDVIPEDIEKNLLQEIPQPRAVPKRLDEYTPEEIAAFPKVWTPPKDFRRK